MRVTRASQRGGRGRGNGGATQIERERTATRATCGEGFSSIDNNLDNVVFN